MEIDKLTIQDLCKYLPWRPKIQWHDGKTGFLLGLDHHPDGDPYFSGSVALNCSRDLNLDRNELMSFNVMPARIGQIKPILRPLSDLTKEIEHNGEKFIPMLKLLSHMGKPNRDISRCKFDGSFIYETGFHYGRSVLGLENTDWKISEGVSESVCKSKVSDWLHKHHFDDNNYIERGLAIDINTIEK